MCRLILDRMTKGKLTINILTWIKAYLIKIFHLLNTLASTERGVEVTMTVDSFSSAVSSLRVFRQDAQIPKKIKVQGFKSIFFKKRREVSRVKPSLKNANLPEPTWRNTPVFFKVIFLIPRSHFGPFLRLLSWLDNASGTPHHAVDPRLQPKPRFPRCNGQMVIEFMFAGWINTAARLRIRSTSLLYGWKLVLNRSVNRPNFHIEKAASSQKFLVIDFLKTNQYLAQWTMQCFVLHQGPPNMRL